MGAEPSGTAGPVKVSLVSTVKDAVEDVGAFLTSLSAQTRPPDEVVIVDGGSTDGTLELLRAWEGITVLEEPGANIARGRNLAIAAAAHDVIAVTDADCVLEPDWLERLLAPIEAGADVAMGAYVPAAEGSFQGWVACLNLPDPAELQEARFMPSHRSVAFRRSAIEAAGGYPEWLEVGEDMYVDHRWRDLGLDLRLARDAVVRWRPRPTPAATWRQYFRYARGDAEAGMYPERHALRFAAYSALGLAWTSRRTWPKVLVGLAGLAYLRVPLARAFRRFRRPGDRAVAAVAVPLLLALVDVAKMAGYLAGLARRARRPPGAQPG